MGPGSLSAHLSALAIAATSRHLSQYNSQHFISISHFLPWTMGVNLLGQPLSNGGQELRGKGSLLLCLEWTILKDGLHDFSEASEDTVVYDSSQLNNT